MRILLCGMGNIDQGDDGFGSYVVQRVQNRDNIKSIDCHLYPENYLSQITSFQPDLIVFLDAVERNEKDVVFLRDEEILTSSPISISTHNLPFSSVYYYLQENCQAHVWLIGARPLSYARLSQRVRLTANRIIRAINSLDKEENINIMNFYEKIFSTLQ